VVLLKGRDDLGYLEGRLSAHFRSVTLTALHAAFLAATDKKEAADALSRVYRDAEKLCVMEKEFNKRAPRGDSSLIGHLRTPEHFTVLRDFGAAKEILLELHPKIGQNIIRLVEKDIDVAAHPVVRTPSVKIL